MRHYMRPFFGVLLFLAFGLIGSVGLGTSSAAPFTDGIWVDVSEAAIPATGERLIIPNEYRTLAADVAALKARLAQAPLENPGDRSIGVVMALPLPDGAFGRFRVVEAPIMEPALAAKFPEIKTYLAQGVDDPTAVARLDYTPSGFHAMILSDSGTIYIDPYSRNNTTHYISYYKRAFSSSAAKGFSEVGLDETTTIPLPSAPLTASGSVLRTYRLAVAATGEYTIFHGGTVQQGMAAIVTSVNRVVGVYERDVAVRMVLVANNDQVVYTDPATDPYTNNNGGVMLGQNQANLDAVIGDANYDVGHVFSTGGGGVASLRVPCRTGLKARGVTGSSQPIGDPFDIDYVAHEMGHQFGANHTFNGTTGACGGGNRYGPTAYEPGSGSTIMAYAGICGAENLQPNSDDYFHVASYNEIIAYTTTGQGNSCPVQTNTGNDAPVVDAGQGYYIPNRTPFKLTGSATDPNSDPLTYNWEQFNIGAAAPPNTDDGTRPIFRSFLATVSSTRIFPRLTNIISNTQTLGEALPMTNRTLTFRLTVRDNRAGGGGVDYDSVNITSTTSAGPFLVTVPNTAVTWTANTQEGVAWDVANTDQAPVSCATADIYLSTDGGYTFPTTLAAGTANDGSEMITVPNVTTNRARVQVACATGIFFDMSNADFTIQGGATPTSTPQVTPTTEPTTEPTATAQPPTAVPPSPTATTAPSATPTQCTVSFSDVPSTNTFYPYVQCLACRGIMGGYNDGTFRPNNDITRGQLSKIVANSAGFNEPVTTQSFEDVTPSNPFYLYVERMAGRGIIGGYTCGGAGEPCVPPTNRPYFRPNNNATRGQISKIVSEAAGFSHPVSGQTFEDVPPSHTFYLWIERLASRGIMGGYACGNPEPCVPPANRPYFRPNNNATRGQVSKIVANTFFPECGAR